MELIQIKRHSQFESMLGNVSEGLGAAKFSVKVVLTAIDQSYNSTRDKHSKVRVISLALSCSLPFEFARGWVQSEVVSFGSKKTQYSSW